MKDEMLNLAFIINVLNFEKIQDSVASATEMALVTVDFKGRPISRHSRCSRYCQTIRANPALRELCERCDSRGGLEAARIQKPYIYVCHMGLVDLAVPIIVGGQYIGAVMAGQVLPDKDSDIELLERLIHDQSKILAPSDLVHINKEKELIPRLPLNRIIAVSNMLFQISNYIVEEAVLKIQVSEDFHVAVSQSKKTSSLGNQNPEDDKQSLDLMPTRNSQQTVKLDDAAPDIISLNVLDNPDHSKVNALLKPAINHITDNYVQDIALDEIAALCNISPGYFSRIFKRSMGCSYTEYISKLRVNRAGRLLLTTDLMVAEIARQVGYDDCGYFIKVFKKLSGSTPSTFRHQH